MPLQARVQPDFRFIGVTAALTEFVKDEWRDVPADWVDRIAGHPYLDFRERPSAEELQQEADQASQAALQASQPTDASAPPNNVPAAAAVVGQEFPGIQVTPTGDVSGPAAAVPDAVLDAEADAEESEAAMEEARADQLRASDATAAAAISADAQQRRQAAAAKRAAAKHASKKAAT